MKICQILVLLTSKILRLLYLYDLPSLIEYRYLHVHLFLENPNKTTMVAHTRKALLEREATIEGPPSLFAFEDVKNPTNNIYIINCIFFH